MKRTEGETTVELWSYNQKSASTDSSGQSNPCHDMATSTKAHDGRRFLVYGQDARATRSPGEPCWRAAHDLSPCPPMQLHVELHLSLVSGPYPRSLDEGDPDTIGQARSTSLEIFPAGNDRTRDQIGLFFPPKKHLCWYQQPGLASGFMK